ncbi:MAG: DUF2007 domain-containing protein [Chitinophagaceae bacterium]
MEFTIIQTYDNYVSAHIAMGRLQEDGINCWLKDENTVTIDPILTNAIGGIKLMVASSQAERASRILQMVDTQYKSLYPCPKCDSQNVDVVSTPRKASNWASALIGFFFTSYAMPIETVHHCFECGYEYKVEEISANNNELTDS